MTAGGEPEQRVADALRARATGAGQALPGRAVAPATRRSRRSRRSEPPPGLGTGAALMITLLAGAVLGMAAALLSLLVPGALPPLG